MTETLEQRRARRAKDKYVQKRQAELAAIGLLVVQAEQKPTLENKVAVRDAIARFTAKTVKL